MAAGAVVVGAGPTGLALACGLRAAGVSVRLIDRAERPATSSRALGLQPRGAEVLDRLGALGGLPERSVRVKEVVTHVNGELLARLRADRPATSVRPVLITSQAEVEAGLRRRLRELGGDVEWGKELLAADQDAHGITARLSGEVVRAEWLIGCDGAHSRVRRLAGIAFPGAPVAEGFLLADVRAELPLPRDVVSTWLRKDEMFGIFPLPGDDLWRLVASSPEGGVGAEQDFAVLTRLLRDRSGIAPPAAPEPLWTSAFRAQRRLATDYRRGRFLLAGDAAHVHSPFGGQGMNTGLGDAENLAWKLALVMSGRAGERLLDTYGAERRPVAREVVAMTSGATRLLVSPSAPAQAVRDHALVPLLNRQRVQRLLWEKTSQLGVGYRGGPLAGRSPVRFAAAVPRAGDRVPDVLCNGPDGTRTRLYAALGGTWALVAPAGTASTFVEAARRHLGGADAVVALTFSADGRKIMLVRPDGHLGWSGGSSASLESWLARAVAGGRPRTPFR
ncbi:FAD-dependent monooxygenase [Streptomyces sp. NBC_01618]|nr:FAD-dependent monooxygenase [Streptomyces sp. NBC_01618]